MKKSCYRCGGDGFLPEFSHIAGGACFTCGGDGTIDTFSAPTVKKKSREEARAYFKHTSTRDLANAFIQGDANKLEVEQLTELRKELESRAKKSFGFKGDFLSVKDMKDVIRQLDETEANMPRPYENSSYFKQGKVELVPVHWLQKFQGNNLRRDSTEMKKFAAQLKEEGLKEPVMLMFGQTDRRVAIGEGNHRVQAFIEAGLDYIPVRVSRNSGTVGTPMSQFYNKMSRVPVRDYFKADAAPSEVFDTFDDHDSVSPLTKKSMKSLEFEEVPAPFLEGKKFNGGTIKGLFTPQFKKASKTLTNQFNEMMNRLEELGGKPIDIEFKMTEDDIMEWYSKEDGMMTIDLEEAIPKLDSILVEMEYERIMNTPTTAAVDDDDYDDIDDDLWDLLDIEDI